MWQLLGVVLIIGALALAFQLALILIFLVGLIFRPKETIGLLTILTAFWVLRTYPAPTLAVLAVIGVVALIRNGRNVRAAAKAEPPPELPDDATG